MNASQRASAGRADLLIKSIHCYDCFYYTIFLLFLFIIGVVVAVVFCCIFLVVVVVFAGDGGSFSFLDCNL